MAKKIDPDKMSRAELEEYVNSLPEERPPKMSSAGWLAALGAMAILAFWMKLNTGDKGTGTWLILAGGIGCFIGAGYLVYKVVTYRHTD
ncbi:MAG: hypothetical protein IJZ68_07160 [Bacteroidaceae bacterium]|nr:hypothetical protein [Bacteroidaceae bacterium]